MNKIMPDKKLVRYCEVISMQYFGKFLPIN